LTRRMSNHRFGGDGSWANPSKPIARRGIGMADERSPLRLLGLREVAAVLGTDWRNVRALVERGELPAVHVGATREPRISLAMLEAWQRCLAASDAVVPSAI